MAGNLTPQVEDNLKERIGISSEWADDNLGVYFTMLAEEIEERTEWNVSVHSWHGGWGGATHRLLVRRKATQFEEVVRRIQILGINQGKVLAREKIESALHTILD